MGTGSLPPPYPVINGKPTLLAALRNFQLGDWGRMIFCTALGGVWGFAAGKPIRRHGSINMAMSAALLCFGASFQSSWHRLTGQRPNPLECARAGIPFEHA